MIIYRVFNFFSGDFFERRSESVRIHPIEELDDGRLVRCEVEKWMPKNGGEHIQVVGQTPVVFVMPGLGRKVGRVYQKYDVRSVCVLGKQFAVVSLYDLQSVKVSVAVIGRQLRGVVECLLFHFADIGRVLPGKQNRGGDSNVVDESILLVSLQQVYDRLAFMFGNLLHARQAGEHRADFGDDDVRPFDVFDTEMEVIEVVIDYTRIGSLTFYDMGEQAGTAKEVDESRRGGELL